MGVTQIIKRRTDIDIARALAVFTIVLHHISQYVVRYDFIHISPELAGNIVATVSFVNVTTFMFIAGIVLSFKNSRICSLKDYWQFERKKLTRLILPFVTISMMQLAIKLILFDAPKLQISTLLKAMMLTPIKGPAPHLWFLYVLMGIFLIWPLFGKLTTTKLIPLLWLVLFIIAVLPIQWPRYGKIPGIIGYLPIFTLGYWYNTSSLAKRQYGFSAVIIAAALVISARLSCTMIHRSDGFLWAVLYRVVRLAGYSCGALFILWLSEIISRCNNKLSKALEIAGRNSYDIYLLHVALVAHPLMFILSRTLDPDIFMTWVLFVFAALATMIVPIFIGKIIRLVPILAFVMLGVPLRKN